METEMTVFFLFASFTIFQVRAIGFCDNKLVKHIMDINGCPSDNLQYMYDHMPNLTFRVLAKSYTQLAKCHTGVMDKPDKNVASFRAKFTFNSESGVADRIVNYTLVEAKCGMVFKYDEARSYVAFKMVFAYADAYTFGYYGCSNEITDNPDEIYAACISTSNEDPKVDESVAKCKKQMEEVTLSTDLDLLPSDCK